MDAARNSCLNATDLVLQFAFSICKSVLSLYHYFRRCRGFGHIFSFGRQCTVGYGLIFIRVTTCLENLEMSGNSTAVRDFTNSQRIVWKNCLKLFIVSCIFVSIQVFSTGMGMMWVTLNMPNAIEKCHELSGNFTWSESGNPVLCPHRLCAA